MLAWLAFRVHKLVNMDGMVDRGQKYWFVQRVCMITNYFGDRNLEVNAFVDSS